MSNPLVLLVLDGWGLRPQREHNAIALARTPVFDELWRRYPHTQLTASGEAVGLPPPSGMFVLRLSTGGEIQMAVTPRPARYDIFC